MTDDAMYDDVYSMSADDGDAQIEAILAELDVDDLDPPAPPPSLWSKIEAAATDDDTGDGNEGKAPDRGDAVPEPPAAGHTDAEVVPIAQARADKRAVITQHKMGWIAAAAAVVALVAGGAWWSQRTTTEVVAVADLAYEDGFDPAGQAADGTAELLERDGTYAIEIRDPQLPTDLGEAADLELWLIEARPDGSLDVQPVAIIRSDDGTYPVPAGLDPTTHNIVDISIEPRDGDTTHSGRSILRGPLESV